VSIKTILLFLLLVLPGTNYSRGIETGVPVKVEANPKNNFYWPYYIYVPDSASINNIDFTFLVLPNNTGKVNDSLSVHEARALKTLNNGKEIAAKLNLIVIVPVFPRSETTWKEYTHALDRDVMLSKNDSTKRLDLQLLSMISDARMKVSLSDLKVREKIIMMGFSASGMFVNRFALIHPDIVAAAAVGSPGGWPIVPVSKYNNAELNYPVGINDFKTITGGPFNKEEFAKAKIRFFLGDQDDNDSVPFDDSYDDPERKTIMDNFGANLQERWKIATSIYEKEGFTNCSFVIYPGVGHSLNNKIFADLSVFFEAALKKE